MAEKRKCRAVSKQSGQQCRRWAIPGGLVCSMHGGKAPQVIAAAKRRLAVEEARELVAELRAGVEVEVAPEDAILTQVWESAGMVAVLRGLVEQLEPTFGSGGLADRTGNERKLREAAPHVFVSMWNEERDRLVRVAKVAVEVGLSERMVHIAETQAELMVRAFMGALDDEQWGLSAAQRKAGRQVLGRHLTAVRTA